MLTAFLTLTLAYLLCLLAMLVEVRCAPVVEHSDF
jgi:hypothetical protein